MAGWEDRFARRPEFKGPREIDPVFGVPLPNYHLAPGEELVQCPYDKYHLVRTVRMNRHMNRCRRNYDLVALRIGGTQWQMTCPLGCRINTPEMEDHLKICKPVDFSCLSYLQKEIDLQKSQQSSTRKTRTDSVPVENFEEEEDWEKDALPGYVPGYDPSIKLAREGIIIFPTGFTKAQNKHFYNLTRERAEKEALRKKNPPATPTSLTTLTPLTKSFGEFSLDDL